MCYFFTDVKITAQYYNSFCSTYILLDVLVCSIAVYFYESKYKWWVKIYSDTKNV